MIVVIPTTIPAVALFGFLSFYAVAVTKAVSAVLAAATTTAVTVSGLSFYFYAVATEILSANLRTLIIDILISDPAAVHSAAEYMLNYLI